VSSLHSGKNNRQWIGSIFVLRERKEGWRVCSFEPSVWLPGQPGYGEIVFGQLK
jgi:hypothetical protein